MRMIKYTLIIVTIYFSIYSGLAQEYSCFDLPMRSSFKPNAVIENDFFNKYYIEKDSGTYIIYATIDTLIDYQKLIALMNNFELLPDFMPGYQAIYPKETDSNHLVTGVVFKLNYAPKFFTSYFTNEVEIKNQKYEYFQCWKQLPENDPRIVEEYKRAPVENTGFWHCMLLKNDKVRINYYLKIKPPVKIPQWLYQLIVKNTYIDVFKAVITASIHYQELVKNP